MQFARFVTTTVNNKYTSRYGRYLVHTFIGIILRTGIMDR